VRNGYSTVSLGFSTTTNGADVTVAVQGELDLASTPEFEARMTEILDPNIAKTLVLDLSALEFMDSTGLRVLWAVRQRAQDAACRLVLRSPSDAVMRLLRLTGMHRVFQIETDQATRRASAATAT
jgi:anti-anti-sigma factor